MAVSVKDVAAHAGLSVGTVSNVLNRPEKVAEATRVKVLDAIAELGFVRNEAARQLRAGLSRTVGLLVLNPANPFFTDIAEGAEQYAGEHAISILTGSSAEDPSREDHYLELFEQQRVRGILVSPVGDVTGRLTRMRQLGIAGVLVDRDHTGGRFSSVSVDDVLGGQLALTHLADLGHTHVGFVGGPSSLPQVADRLEGACRAAGERGVRLEHLEVSSLHLRCGREAGLRLLDRPAAERPTALFAANDLVALGLLQALLGAGVRVPQDMALVGYDDIDFAAGAAVPLTSIAQPSHEIGTRAMELLLAESDDPERPREHVVLTPTLVVRRSTDADAPIS
ncbi:LacI family DNA-binding transcriptional regulator [Propioniciclava soli]|uniref:LacI family DNA-binding transcriptional regulator n=1 Tax=Propioniciclava soli TaxID=2775081 RepID=A0ABZ3C9E4_9ACTN